MDQTDQIERFCAKVKFGDTPDDCWLWDGSLLNGYGQFYVGGGTGKQCGAHRAAYELFVGPIPDGYHIDHLCQTRDCVHPDHLEAVTPRENILRGTGAIAQNARKTHCPQGHPYDEENTMRINNGRSRRCRICYMDSQRRYANKKRGLL